MAQSPAHPSDTSPPASAAPPPPAIRGTTLRLVRLWSVDLPVRIGGVLPRLADAFADGAWMARWPGVAAFAPIAAAIAGLVFALVWVNVAASRVPTAYTEFPPFLWIAIAAAFLSGTLAAALLIGYVVGDLLVGVGFPYGGLLGLLGSSVGYLLLGVVLILTPRLARWLAGDTVLRIQGRTPTATATILAGLQALAAALLVYVWSQGMVLLVGPVYTFRGITPSADAIMPVQVGWIWLVLAALAAVGVRFVLELRFPAPAATRDLPRALRILRREERSRRQGATAPGWGRVPVVARVAVMAGLAALVLSGTYGNFIEPIAVALVVFLLAAWQLGVFGSRMFRPAPWLERLPALVRVIAAVAIGFAVSFVLLTIFQADSGGAIAVVPGALATVAAFFLLFPPSQPAVRPLADPSSRAAP